MIGLPGCWHDEEIEEMNKNAKPTKRLTTAEHHALFMQSLRTQSALYESIFYQGYEDEDLEEVPPGLEFMEEATPGVALSLAGCAK